MDCECTKPDEVLSMWIGCVGGVLLRFDVSLPYLLPGARGECRLLILAELEHAPSFVHGCRKHHFGRCAAANVGFLLLKRAPPCCMQLQLGDFCSCDDHSKHPCSAVCCMSPRLWDLGSTTIGTISFMSCLQPLAQLSSCDPSPLCQ